MVASSTLKRFSSADSFGFFKSLVPGESYGSRQGQEAGAGMEARCGMQEKN